jgi:hypothetical protein
VHLTERQTEALRLSALSPKSGIQGKGKTLFQIRNAWVLTGLLLFVLLHFLSRTTRNWIYLGFFSIIILVAISSSILSYRKKKRQR